MIPPRTIMHQASAVVQQLPGEALGKPPLVSTALMAWQAKTLRAIEARRVLSLTLAAFSGTSKSSTSHTVSGRQVLGSRCLLC